MADLYNISIIPKPDVTREQIEEKLNLAVDWYRYRAGCYVVHTTSDAAKWQSRLKPLVEPGGNLFICKFDHSQFNGWMPKKFWEWFKAKQKE